jgi:hypothetical protein
MRDIILKVLKEEVGKGKVICDNCGWSWKISEGGHDLYICHQCNHNNEPKNLKESYRHPNQESFNKYFLLVKKYWDKVGLSRKSEKMAGKYILDSSLTFPFAIEYLGGTKKFMKEISDKIENQVFDCRECEGYNFKYYVEQFDVESNYNFHEINVGVVVDTSISGRTYSYEDGFTNVDYQELSNLEGSEFYGGVIQELKGIISEELEKKIDAPFELWADIVSLDFETFN